MSVNDSKYEGKLSSFYDILCHTGEHDDDERLVDTIVIPIIQRDFAQGRKGATKIRERFLKALFDAIDTADSKPIELDFIYGELVEKKRENIFYPLDGQQRLTTLFLLHWYVAKRIKANRINFLNKFSYETRESSKQFCDKLFALVPNFAMPIDEYIKDKSWFTGNWGADPTIDSMLVVLRAIDDHYRNFTNEQLEIVWENLIGNGTIPYGKITFYKLYLDEMDMSDSLYIKMNSRGKPLTDFEHFKAELSRYVAKVIVAKIDVAWTNLLWSYRDQSNDLDSKLYEQNGLDVKFLHLIKSFLVIYIVTNDIAEYNDALSMDCYDLLYLIESSDNETSTCCDDMVSFLDFLCSIEISVSEFFNLFLTDKEMDEKKVFLYTSDSRNKIGIDILKTATDGVLTYNSVILQYTFLICIKKYDRSICDSNSQEYSEILNHLRIIRNLMINSQDRMRSENIKSILNRVKLIIEADEIAEGALDFTILQKKQELLKNRWINGDIKKYKAISKTENNHLLYGNLAALDVTDGEYNISHLDKFCKLFSNLNSGKTHQIEQALMSIGDYGNLNRGMYNYGGVNGTDCNGNWRSTVFIHGNKTTPRILCSLLDQLTNCDSAELQQIIDKYKADCRNNKEFPWRYYFVAHSGFRHGDSGKFWEPDTKEAYERIMMRRSQFNGYWWNPFLFCLSRKIAGCTLDNYGGALMLDNGTCQLSCRKDSYILEIAGDGKYVIEIPQNTNGIDIIDRIEYIASEDVVKSNADVKAYLKAIGKREE